MPPINPLSPVALVLSSLIYLFGLFGDIPHDTSRTVTIETTFGALKGSTQSSRSGLPYYEFLGVPYAKPPVGELRFERPMPPEKWSGMRDATKHGARCIQHDLITSELQGDEDCLYLNIFTPISLKKDEVWKAYLVPVLVFIHGGLFMSGSADPYGAKYFMDETCVLVTLNYRLGPFGFLNTGDGVVRGNMGLKDQNMALRWIYENIKYFGGDPSRITLAGESAGGASVHFHILSPMSRGLFSRAISQSGTALSPWALVHNPKDQSRRLGQQFNCPLTDTKQMVQCLKSVNAMELAVSQVKRHIYSLDDYLTLYGPTIESVNDSSTFLAEHPRNILSAARGPINPVPWLSGVNSEEGLPYVIIILREEKLRLMLNSDWNQHAPIIFDYAEHPQKDEISRRIHDHYLGDSRISKDTVEPTSRLFTDRGFFEDSRDAALLHSQFAPVYSYYFNYKGEYNLANTLTNSPKLVLPDDELGYTVRAALQWLSASLSRHIKKGRKELGSAHGDELYLLFNIPYFSKLIGKGDKDYEFSRAMVYAWVSFARYGEPDLPSGSPIWDPVNPYVDDKDAFNRLKLDKSQEMIKEPFIDNLNFWKTLNITTTNRIKGRVVRPQTVRFWQFLPN